ncbi:MAG: hypothetical protein DID92_2727743561 [Candidatus Nitrotoga sp. SPKER]|nr:MAG: hypothetical protein DID92_2727743561 [Candidatus Nitrotoga sp. SPKER]
MRYRVHVILKLFENPSVGVGKEATKRKDMAA